MASEMKEFTAEELKAHNGKEQSTVYIAHGGKVYDVSASKYWKTGTHMKRHPSGVDLTGEINAAPHGPEVMERLTQVGVLQPEKDPMDERLPAFLVRLLDRFPFLRRHPHPITVHFPIAFLAVFPLFNVLYVLTGDPRLETTAFHLFLVSLLSMPVAMVTGPYAWWINYGGRMSTPIRVKSIVAALLFVLVLIGFGWRASQPEVLTGGGSGRWAYLALTLSYPVLSSVLGWFGAKMTFPD